MKRSEDRIQTSHAGSLPRTDELIELNRARQAGETDDEAGFQSALTEAVADVVRRQRDAGISVPGDGEYGKAMGQKVNFGAWWSYSFQRLGGLVPGPRIYDMPPVRSEPGRVVLTSFADRRDRHRFAAAYADPESGVSVGKGAPVWPKCVGPITYTGQAAIAADIANFKAALAAAGADEGFMTAVAPGSAARIANEFYETEEAFIWACADAMREEYRAIIDAGLVLQLDDPSIAENWDQVNPEPSVEDYRRFTTTRVEAINHAIRGLPKERIRFHLCWGSWHGPHMTDIPMADIVDTMLAIDVGAYSFEAGNVRHEHEWKVWQDTKLPEGKLILPGVVSHATNVVEHPELVADRICRFAELVGRENVIASTDCGLGGRVHADIAWAKLEVLAQGAELATQAAVVVSRFPSQRRAVAPADVAPVTSRKGHFWVGVEPDPAVGVARGPMYVYWEAPAEVTQPYPIVLVHGGGGQGLDYLTTPDGRPGFATLLVEQGWVVYVVDRPGHGRSAFVPELMGEAGPPLPMEVLKGIFVPTSAGAAAAPNAALHTQWPGDRDDPADPALLQFLASGGPFAGDAVVRQACEQARLVELLDRIGPAFVLANSMGGPSGFLVADARPDAVVALVQLEPIGPAFATSFGPGTLQWGVSAVPVAYDPPAADPSDLALVTHETAPGVPPYALQAEPARRLANLAQVPIAVVSGEASPFRFSDPPLVAFLRQAGCDAVHLDLAEHGVHGNAHGAMFERNNAEVLAVVTGWMLRQLG